MTRGIPELELRRFPELLKEIPDEIGLQFPEIMGQNGLPDDLVRELQRPPLPGLPAVVEQAFRNIR